MKKLSPGVLIGAIVLAGCAATPPTPAGLAGSSWTLAAFRAPGAAELHPARVDQYRLDFLADGRLAARIDCNSGRGTWQATPDGTQQGRMRLGPLGTTRMMCPPSPLGGRLPADIEAIQSYRLADGKLYLDLAGDGGSYVWEPARP